MNNKKIVASLLGLGLIAVGIGTHAYQWNHGIQNPDCTATERHAAITQMFADKDYEQFKILYADKGVTRRITSKDQFLKFAELHEAGLAGDTDKVNELKAELGLGKRNGSGQNKWIRWNRHGNGDHSGQGRRGE